MILRAEPGAHAGARLRGFAGLKAPRGSRVQGAGLAWPHKHHGSLAPSVFPIGHSDIVYRAGCSRLVPSNRHAECGNGVLQGRNTQRIVQSVGRHGVCTCTQELVEKKMALAELHEALLKASHRPREAGGEQA